MSSMVVFTDVVVPGSIWADSSRGVAVINVLPARAGSRAPERAIGPASAEELHQKRPD